MDSKAIKHFTLTQLESWIREYFYRQVHGRQSREAYPDLEPALTKLQSENEARYRNEACE